MTVLENQPMLDHPVVREIRGLAAWKPDHVDPNALEGKPCNYYENGHPSCIIGHVIHNLYFGEYNVMLEGKSALILHAIDPSIPDEVLFWAIWAQGFQDQGKTWAEAVQGADANLIFS